MEVASRFFLKKKFMQYYSTHAVAAPKEIERREFGVGTLTEKIKTRHKSFKSERELQGFLKREAPYYISYSAAFYDFPDQGTMKDKKWRGAELIFDLDIPMTYPNHDVMEKVKTEALTLISYLKDDFGFSDSEIEVNFSGSKGYHIHVNNDKALPLGREERREIVDYLTGKIDFRGFLRIVGTRDEKVIGPKKGDKGWYGRIYKSLYNLISNASAKELEEIPGIGEKKAAAIIEKKERILAALDEGRYDLIPEIISIERNAGRSADPNVKGVSRIENVKAPIIENIIAHSAIHMETKDTDKMVTIDTSRLIRLPDTIHGGSGLVAKKVMNSLEEFDPLRDALAFGKEPTRIQLKDAVPEFDLGGSRIGPFDPGVIEVPEYAAIYLLLKDKADVVQ